jgi:AcrR family transcriptional regulator
LVSQQPDRSARRKTRQDSRRQSILDAAAEEFAESGYERATLDRIGERVGLSKGSLYYYVSGKEQLLAELVERFVDDIEERVRESGDRNEGALAALSAVVSGHIGATRSALGRALTENLHVLRHGVARTQSERYERIVAGVIEAGIESGVIRVVPVRPAVKLVIGAMNGVSQWFSPSGKLSLDEVVEGVVGVLLHGVEVADGQR